MGRWCRPLALKSVGKQAAYGQVEFPTHFETARNYVEEFMLGGPGVSDPSFTV